MFEGKTIAVVVPAFNEERQIAQVIATMPEFVDHIVVIDDASRDSTVQVVEALAAENPQGLHLLRHGENQGVGAAIATGYVWARDHGVDIAAVMAGDGQMDPADLPDLLRPVAEGRSDYAKGDRLTAANALATIPKLRFIGNSILTLLTKIASGYWHVVDSQTGYTAIGKRALATLDWSRMYRRYGQPNHLLVMLNIHNFRVCDIPIKPVYNVGEVSGIRIRKVVFTISWLLLKSFLWRMLEKYIVRDFHPLVLFYALGVLMCCFSGLFFIRLIILWIANGFVPDITFLAWMFASSVGLQSLFFAMWFDMEYNRHLRGG